MNPGRWALGETRGTRGVQRSYNVRADWLAALPEEQDRLFTAIHAQLESSYQITSIALNDALTLCREGRLPPAAEQSAIVGTLFDGLAQQIQAVLRSLSEHSRHFGTVPAVVPLRPGFFRSINAQRIARNNHLVSRVLFSTSARFSRKTRALLQIVASAQNEARYMARTRNSEMWNRLDELHYDLNTCLRETMVVLKSFLCVLPSPQLPPFQLRLQARMPGNSQFFFDDRPVSEQNS